MCRKLMNFVTFYIVLSCFIENIFRKSEGVIIRFASIMILEKCHYNFRGVFIAMGKEQFAEAISLKRDEMIKIGISKGLLSEETIICSQELDNLLNEYSRFL